MKTSRLWRALLSLVLLSTLSNAVYAQGGDSPSPCRSYLPTYDYLLDVPELTAVRAWHESGYCGQGLTVGILAANLPIENIVGPLLDEGLLVINQDEFSDEYRPDPDSTLAVRVTNQLIFLHTIAPAAHLYYYGLPQDSTEAPTLAAEFSRGATVLLEPTLPYASDFPAVRIISNLIANPFLASSATVDPLYDLMADETVLWLNAAGDFGHSYLYLELAPEYINQITDWLSLLPGSLRVPDSDYMTDDQFIPFARLDETANVVLVLTWTVSAGDFTLYFVDDPLIQNRITASVDNPSPGVVLARPHLDAGQNTFYVAIEHSRQSNAQVGEAHLYGYNAVTALTDNSDSIPPPNDYPGTITVGALWPDETPDSLQSASGQAGDKPEITAYGTFGENGETSSGYATLVTAGVAALYRSAHPAISPVLLAEQMLPTTTSRQLRIAAVPYDWQRLFIYPIIILVVGLIGMATGLIRRYHLSRKVSTAFAKIDAANVACKLTPDKSQLTIVLGSDFTQHLPAIALLERKLTVIMKFPGRLGEGASRTPEIWPQTILPKSEQMPNPPALPPVLKQLMDVWQWAQGILRQLRRRPMITMERSGKRIDGFYLAFDLWIKRLPTLYEDEYVYWVYQGIEWNAREGLGKVKLEITGRLGSFSRELTPEIEPDNTP